MAIVLSLCLGSALFAKEEIQPTGYPVYGFYHEKLFDIYAKSGSFGPDARAAAISKRIHDLGNAKPFSQQSLQLVEEDGLIDINLGTLTIISISKNDALLSQKDQRELAETYAKRITQSVLDYQTGTSKKNLLAVSAVASGVLMGIFALIGVIWRFFGFLNRALLAEQGKRIRPLTVNGYTLLKIEQIIRLLQSGLTLLKWGCIALISYLGLPLLFRVLPWTRRFSDTLLGYVLTPLSNIVFSVWHYLPNVITILIIVTVFKYIFRGLHYLKTELETGALVLPNFYADWANPTYQIVRILVTAFMLVLIFPYLPGSNSPVFQGVSVFLGFLFTFGSASSLSNIVSGLILTYMRLFRIGDRVKIGETEGDIIEKSLLVTRIRTPKNEIVSVPNSTIMTSHTINYSSNAKDRGLVVHTTVTIGYDTPWRTVHEALIFAATKTPHILTSPEPFVLQTALNDFYVSYQLNAYTQEANKQPEIYSTLHQNIQDACAQYGIEIMSPHYRAHRDGNATTLPEKEA